MELWRVGVGGAVWVIIDCEWVANLGLGGFGGGDCGTGGRMREPVLLEHVAKLRTEALGVEDAEATGFEISVLSAATTLSGLGRVGRPRRSRVCTW